MRRPSAINERETWAAVLRCLQEGRSIVSASWIDKIITEHPYPNMARLPDRDRLHTITYYLNQWYPPVNQTGAKPRARTWILEEGIHV